MITFLMGLQLFFMTFVLTIIGDIFDVVVEVIEAVIAIFISLFADDGIVAIFYDGTTGLTFIGALLLIIFGFGLVTWAFNFVKKLIQMRK